MEHTEHALLAARAEASQRPRSPGFLCAARRTNGQHQVHEKSDWGLYGSLFHVSWVTPSVAPSMESVRDVQGKALSLSSLSAQETSCSYFL